MQDLQHAIDLTPDTDAKAECHTERGMTFQKMHDFARAVRDLRQVGCDESVCSPIFNACSLHLCTTQVMSPEQIDTLGCIASSLSLLP